MKFKFDIIAAVIGIIILTNKERYLMKLKMSLIVFLIVIVSLFAACSKNNAQASSGALGQTSDASESLIDFAMYTSFNGEMIPWTPHYSPFDGDFGNFKLDRLKFLYNGKIHELSPVQAELLVYDDDAFLDKIDFADYNFDGFLDIAFRSYFGPVGKSEIFMYNPQTLTFYRHEELSGMESVGIDEETQTIKTFEDGGDRGRIYDSREYKWINGQLTLIHSDSSSYDADLDLYVRITRTLQGNAVWSEHRETFSQEEG